MKKIPAVLAALTLSVVLAIGMPASSGQAAAAVCSNTSTGYKAITDLGTGTYAGEQGGLYPGGSNVPPSQYHAAGVKAARSVVPLDRSGNPSRNGSIVFLSIGMSNASMEFDYFYKSEKTDTLRNPAVALVNGAQSGAVAKSWTSASYGTWSIVDQRLSLRGFTDKQVEVIWLKEADSLPKTDFETYAHGLQHELALITQIAAQKYPNLRQVFVSARTYSGYGPLGPNPEPYAYETGFADKFFVAQSVANPAARPWVGWGPYFWTDGTRGRADGLKWYCSDTFDGTHPSLLGLIKINALMHAQFTSSDMSLWFGPRAYVPPGTPTAAPKASPPAAGASPGASQAGAGQTSTPGQGSTGSNPSGNATASPPATFIRAAFSMASQHWPLTLFIVLLIAAGAVVIGLGLLPRWRRGIQVTAKREPPSPGVEGAEPPPDTSPEAPEAPVLVGSSQGGKPPTP